MRLLRQGPHPQLFKMSPQIIDPRLDSQREGKDKGKESEGGRVNKRAVRIDCHQMVSRSLTKE